MRTRINSNFSTGKNNRNFLKEILINYYSIYRHQSKFKQSAIFTSDNTGAIGIVLNGVLPIGTMYMSQLLPANMTSQPTETTCILSPNPSVLLVTQKYQNEASTICNIDLRAINHEYYAHGDRD